MKRVVIESPYSGHRASHSHYLNRCIADSLSRGEAPIASHKSYTDALDDNKPDERAKGIAAGQAWLPFAEVVAVYGDLSITPGMIEGINAAKALGVQVEYRSIGR